MKRESFLLFVPLETRHATAFLEVRIQRTDETIGHIVWQAGWRQYGFVPPAQAAYTRRVLQLIARKMGRLTKQWLDRKQAADPTFTPTRGAPLPKSVRHTRPGRPMLERGL